MIIKKILFEIEKEIGYTIPENTVYEKSEKSLKVCVKNRNITVEYKDIWDIACAALILKGNSFNFAKTDFIRIKKHALLDTERNSVAVGVLAKVIKERKGE